MYNLEIGAAAFKKKKKNCSVKLAVEHDFCDIEIGTYHQQQIKS